MAEQDDQTIASLSSEVEQERSARLQAESIAARKTRQLASEHSRLELLLKIAEAANEAQNFHDLFKDALAGIASHTGWAPGPVYIQAKEKGHTFRLDLFSVAGVPLPGKLENLLPASLIEQVLQTARPVSHRFPGVPDNDKPAWMQVPPNSIFAFPLVVGAAGVGVLIFFGNNKNAPDEKLSELMRHAGTQLGRAIERQRDHDALEKSEAYFRRLTENSLDVITILDANGTILYESPSVEQVFGYAPDDYRGHELFEFVHPEDVAGVKAAFANTLDDPSDTPRLNFRFRRKDGEWRHVEGVGKNLLSDPVVSAVVFNSRDITERRNLEEQFLQSQKVQAIGQLAGGVAHDFNNILTAIIGHAELMLQSAPAADPLHGHADEIQKAAHRAAGLTRQLLAFSRKQVLQPKVIDLNSVIAEMNKMLQRLLGENIRLVTKAERDLGHVKADPGQMEQVILNLAVNARDAMPAGGTLTIQTENVGLGPKSEAGRGDFVLVAVSDTGVGMPPEVQARIFEPFLTTKELGKGTGLGLATCHGIIKQSEGHIGVFSRLGKGTTFKILLPRINAPLDVVATKPQEAPRSTHGHERVLLVEDEPMLRELAVTVLKTFGYEVMTAENGVLALDVVKELNGARLDLLITDVVMPEMGGRELAEKLQKLHPKTKVLFCSGYTEDSVIAGAEAAGCFLQKPYTMATLGQKVREILDKK
ncbi:MAG TPA: PAS domain S-box protein [Verrucomicrobiae bacterium]|nr:PAS domain S-box protein [Verrucomicrobiae bacterium]